MNFSGIFPDPVNDLLIIIVGCIAVYFAWRSGKNKQITEAVSNYEKLTASQDKVIAQLKDEIASIRVDFEKRLDKSEKENHDLRAQVNQLIGENKGLTKLVTLQDPFRDKIDIILGHQQQIFDAVCKGGEKTIAAIEEK